MHPEHGDWAKAEVEMLARLTAAFADDFPLGITMQELLQLDGPGISLAEAEEELRANGYDPASLAWLYD